MLVRFVSPLFCIESQARLGVFIASSHLLDSGRLDSFYEEELSGVWAWFNEHLPFPWKKSFRDGRGICWFKDEAEECIARLWSLVAILRENGIPVEFIQARNPGWWSYEDRYQVVAIPYSDRCWRKRRHASLGFRAPCACIPVND